MLKLVIAEKPSVGKSIAAVLNAKKRGDGFFEGNNYIVSWCIGHLLQLAPPDAYTEADMHTIDNGREGEFKGEFDNSVNSQGKKNEKYGKWRYEDLPIIPEKWKHTVAPGKKKQLDILKSLMKRADVDAVICATDAGREGELIFRLVYEHCGCKKPVQRLWISSMEESTIAEGFRKLRPGADYDTLYQAALCRSQADWIVGINATRLFSVLYCDKLNVGRVQSPTLALIVGRESEIATFIKEPFYTPEIDCGTFTASGDKLGDKATAESIRTACNGKTASIVSVERLERSAASPKLYDLTTLQREANRLHGFTAQQTLDYVQSLYEKKLATYPRTDSRFLTEDMAANIPVIVNLVALILPGVRGKTPIVCNAAQVINNDKVTDHHAIIPTLSIKDADLASLPAGERDILFMLAAQLICAVGDKHTYAETTVALDCEGNSFTAKGKTVLKDGWKAVEQNYKSTLKSKPDNDGDIDKALPELTEGQTFENIRATVKEGFSSPPKHFTEDLLLAAMETAGADNMLAGGLRPDDAQRKGLGTPATRAGIIEKLVKTGYMERKSKQLLPTAKGVNLIAVLPDVIKSPALTAEWESKLKQVEHGELSDAAFIGGIKTLTSGLVAEHSAPSAEHIALFGRVSDGEAVGACPRCGGSVRENKKGFFCDNRTCSFALWRNNRFFTAKKKTVTKAIAAALLTEGRVFLTGLFSEKSGKTYDATIILDDTGEKAEAACRYVNFKMEFESKKGAKK